MYMLCRKQQILSFKDIHGEPHKLLKAKFTSESAALCIVEPFNYCASNYNNNVGLCKSHQYCS